MRNSSELSKIDAQNVLWEYMKYEACINLDICVELISWSEIACWKPTISLNTGLAKKDDNIDENKKKKD